MGTEDVMPLVNVQLVSLIPLFCHQPNYCICFVEFNAGSTLVTIREEMPLRRSRHGLPLEEVFLHSDLCSPEGTVEEAPAAATTSITWVRNAEAWETALA